MAATNKRKKRRESSRKGELDKLEKRLKNLRLGTSSEQSTGRSARGKRSKSRKMGKKSEMPMDQGRNGSDLAALRSQLTAACERFSELKKELEQLQARYRPWLESIGQPVISQPAPNTNEEVKRTQNHSSETGQKKTDPPSKGSTFRALHHYHAKESDEISLSPGDAVRIVNATDDGGCTGISPNGDCGMFPVSCVEFSIDAFKDTSTSGTKTVKALLYDYTAGDADELSFDDGDIITNVEDVDDGWAAGDCNGKHGLFPTNFVERI
ncbi:SH3 domain-containing protein 19-like isoform X2 [Sycon ciliatum]|uniref:SH3 domain-containing protein 19-like isoform X2 n=1 Tax=Sycon ciliatum TaxID=27933 RepID=UPI0031F67909